LKEEPMPIAIIPDALGQYLAFKAELQEEKNEEKDICKDLRSIVSQGLALAKSHIFQTWKAEDGMRSPVEDPRFGDLEDIIKALKKAKMKEGYAQGMDGKGYEDIQVMREDRYMELNAELFDAFATLDGLLQAWGVVPMMDKRTAMGILVSKKLVESLDDGRKFEIRTGT